MLCGDLIGEGMTRKVFACKIRDDLVAKVEDATIREFHNALELHFWNNHQHYKPVAKWLAPCEYISPDGRILLQQRCDRLPHDYALPAKLPAFLTDMKRANYGLFRGHFVCLDYAATIPNPSVKLRKAEWWTPLA